MPNKILIPADASPLTWRSSGGSAALTLTSLANNAAREGAKLDLGTPRARLWCATFEFDLAVAAAVGAVAELFMSYSNSATPGTENDGISVTGADAAWAPAAGVDDCKHQLNFIGAVVCSDSAAGTRFRQSFLFVAHKRYAVPVVVNKTGQAFGSTAGNHVVTLTRLEDEVQ